MAPGRRCGNLEIEGALRAYERGSCGARREASTVERVLVRARVTSQQAVEERRQQVGGRNAAIAAAAHQVLREGGEGPRAGRAGVAIVAGIEGTKPRHQAFLQD